MMLSAEQKDSLRHKLDTKLDEVMDPCSLSAGAPLSIKAMGLIREVNIGDDGEVSVLIRLTSPGCVIGVTQFTREIRDIVAPMEEVTSIDVNFERSYGWSESDITPEGRELLAKVREGRRERADLLLPSSAAGSASAE
ncbi:MAG TPA: iron-sulfur cluster assembly protein [Jatrophihabitantaceae bacterium]|jgi:metal-sulfur cluster biosynthetic enzyme|nr:iron-sulfur cluster assembly protein [Jatrophihabitantaceae bacterium]